jgi:hypothetical protein
MVRARPLDVGQRADGGLPEPREVLEAREQFLVAQQQPEPCRETCVTSGAEVAKPAIAYLSCVSLNHVLRIG